jgi:hypothetical protein
VASSTNKCTILLLQLPMASPIYLIAKRTRLHLCCGGGDWLDVVLPVLMLVLLRCCWCCCFWLLACCRSVVLKL